VVLYIPLNIASLGDSIVTFPETLGRIVSRVIGRVVIVVRALEDLPIIKALLAIFGNVIATAAGIDVPLADVCGVVAGVSANFGEGHCLVSKRSIVKEQAVSQRILACEQTGAIRRTDRTGGNRIG